MKKAIKSLLIVMITLVLVPVVNAVAITTNNTSGTVDPNSKLVTNTSTLTVSGVVSTDTFAAYKILDVFYNSTNNVITYEFTSDFKNFLNNNTTYNSLTVDQYSALTSGNTTNGSTTTNSTLDTLVSQYATYVKANNVSGTNMAVSGTNANATIPAGSYLVLPKTTNKVYAVMVGNIELTANDSEWQISSPTIVAKVSDVGLNKIIKETISTEGTFNIGENYTYQINITAPTYPTNATNTTLTLTDTLDNGITSGAVSTFVVKDGSTTLTTSNEGVVTDTNGHTVATITKNGQTITIEFNPNYLNTRNITIEYPVALNDNAVLGSTGNNTRTTITYTTEPYSTGNSTTSEVTTIVFTYGIDLFKTDTSNNGLEGAVYAIYSNSSLNNEIGRITTGSNGHGTYKGLAAGTYYLKEIKAPSGYKINNNTLTVTIDNTKEYTETTGTDEKVGLLPSTGGIGTYIFIIVGAVIAFVTLFLMINKKNKNESKQK